MKFKNTFIRNGFFLFFTLSWLILWIVFMLRENKKGEHAQLKYLYSHADTEKRRFIMGEQLYDFLDFSRIAIGPSHTYKLVGIKDLDWYRARYMLWPARVDLDAPEFILIYKLKVPVPGGYRIFKQFRGSGIILRKMENGNSIR